MVQRGPFHVGIVVPDLVAARAHFTELLGVVWGPVMESDSVFVDGTGTEVGYRLKVCCSTVAPYLELLEEVPGTTWECNAHSNLHHIGFWSDAIEEDSARWSSARCPLVLGRHSAGELRTAYHENSAPK